MFRKSRRKIVASIMLVLTLLLLGTLAVIYLSSYFEMRYDNFRMLERQAQNYALHADGTIFRPGIAEPDIPSKKPSLELSTFYAVAIGNDGRILATDVGERRVYEEQTLQEYAASILKSGKTRGEKGNLLYYTAQKQGYRVVLFMDNTIVQEKMTLLMRNTLIFGSISMIALFFLSRWLAKKIVAPLEQSYHKQRQFISDAGHELKTPVSVIGANAELLERELGDDRWLANIRYENERMGSLVKQLLALAKTENVEARREHLAYSRLVSGEVLPFESVAYEKGAHLRSEIDEGIFVEGEEQKLKQLVSILVDNAIEHADGEREVLVRLKAEHGTARLSVINDGREIPKQRRAHLFERFYRADEARGDDGHFGLGLAIAKAIVDAHKGKITVDCADGKVMFQVSFPLARNVSI